MWRQNMAPKSTALTLYTRLMRATTTVTEKMHRHLQDHRLSISQFGVLEALYHLGPMCQKEIGGKILKTSGNMTLVIDNLEKSNLVRRQKDPEDRRRTIVTITDKGADVIQTIFPHHENIAREIFSVLDPEEQSTLGTLLKKLGMENLNT
ncbi:MAG TPA: MarR family transcriptional regulator [Desulfobacteraceae bacterium]|nr:MarR family transcriptional regulator [Desulfobacteraceae bacterium]